VKKTEDMFIRFDRIYKLNGQTPHDGIGRALRRIARLKHSDAYKMINAVRYRYRYLVIECVTVRLEYGSAPSSCCHHPRRVAAFFVDAGDALLAPSLRVASAFTTR